jgi:hypothetical protein
VKRLEFYTLPREGGWDYIYLNDDVQGSEGDMRNKRVLFQHLPSEKRRSKQRPIERIIFRAGRGPLILLDFRSIDAFFEGSLEPYPWRFEWKLVD